MSALLARHAPDDEVAFGAEGARTAAELAAYARTIARALPSAERGARVVLACSDRYRFSAGLLAIWLRGLVAELPPNGQAATVHALAAAKGVVGLLHDRDEHTGIDVRPLESRAARAALPLVLELAPDEVAVLAYTSGSTGAPIAQQKTLAQLLREPEAHLARFDLARRRVLAAVPPYHIYGLLFGVLVPLLGGGSSARAAPLLPADLLRALEETRADVLIAVPPHLGALLEHEASAWPRMHRVFSSAAPLPGEVSRGLAARGLAVTEILGSTETGGIAYREAADSAWTPLPSVRVAAASDGALLVDSPWLDPNSERPWRTADRVELVGAGFRHLGRSDAVVKVGGRRIDLGELETRLKAQAGVRDARVLAVESEGLRGLALWAVVELREGAQVEVAALRRALAAHVDPVALPRRFRLVERLPRGETGKVTRAALLALFDRWTFPREPLVDGSVRIYVPANSGFFRGHFDGLPILPGVVQLSEFALREVRARFPELGALTRITRVKFKRLVAPGETMILTLERKKPALVQFALTVDGQPAASGLFDFGAPSSAEEEPR